MPNPPNQSAMQEILTAAINKSLSPLPNSLQKVINEGGIRFIQNSKGYYTFCFVALNIEAYETLTKEAETITKSIHASFNTFCLRFYTENDPIPQENNIGRVAGYFSVDKTWFYKIDNDQHSHWLEIMPEKLIKKVNK